jgi:two-component system cell cycle response regulator
MWEQRHLRALCDHLSEQMDTVTEQRARADQFYGLSILDPLTGLYNRRFGTRRLDEEVSRAAATGDPLMLVSLDFDRFKAINDQHGHAAGDRVLQEFSRRLRRAIRASDVPIRLGGDEFLVILPECPTDQLQKVLSRLTAFDLKLEGGTVHVSHSQGVARYQVGDTAKAMIERADGRLYAEKAKRPPLSGTDASTEPDPYKSDSPVVEYF